MKSRLFDDQQTAVEWTIEACLLPGEPAQISVTVSGETLPGGSPVTPSNVVIVERNDAGQRVDSHGGANSSTVTFDVDPETKSINVTVGRQKGLVKDIEFSLDDL